MGKGRGTTLAWACEHTDRVIGGKGLCTSCYDSQRYWKNPDKIREKRRLDRIANPEKYAIRETRSRNNRSETKKAEINKATRVLHKERYAENPEPYIKAAQAWYAQNKERKAETDRLRRYAKREQISLAQIERMYNFTPEQVRAKFEEQKFSCICGLEFFDLFPAKGKRKWAVDHDHDCCVDAYCCGKCVRGILCTRCNQVLGLLDEDPRLLPQFMLDYLEKYKYIKEIACQTLNSVLQNLQLSAKNTAKEPQIPNLRYLSPSVSAGISCPDNTLYFNCVPPRSSTPPSGQAYL